MTKDFYSLLGSLQSLLFYLYKPGTGDPAEFFTQLAEGTLKPADALLDQPFANVRRFYLLAAGSARNLALSVNALRTASTELMKHPDLQSASRRTMAAGAAGISLDALGANSWLAAAVAHTAHDTLPPAPAPITLKDLEKFGAQIRIMATQGQKFETALMTTALKAEQFCVKLKTAAGDFYNSLQPLVISVGEFDPELKNLLTQVLDDIKASLGFDGSGDGEHTWPSGYVSSSSSSSSGGNSSSSSG